MKQLLHSTNSLQPVLNLQSALIGNIVLCNITRKCCAHSSLIAASFKSAKQKWDCPKYWSLQIKIKKQCNTKEKKTCLAMPTLHGKPPSPVSMYVLHSSKQGEH